MFKKIPMIILPMAIITSTAYSEKNSDGDIVVVASRIEQSPDKVGSSFTIIDRKTIEKRGDVTIADVLARTPSISFSRSGGIGGLTNIRLRGASQAQTLVLIDGIRVSDVSGDNNSFDFSTILAQEIEKIEIIRGNQSALYGSDAIGGVINIITHKRTMGQSGNAFIDGGAFGTIHGGASAKGGNDKVYYGISANHFKNDGYSRKDTDLEKDGANISHIRGNVGIDITDNLNAEFSGGYELADFEFDGFSGSDSDGDKELIFGRTRLTHQAFDDALKNSVFFDASQTDRHDNYGFGFLGDFKGIQKRIGYQGDLKLLTRDNLTLGADFLQETAETSNSFGSASDYDNDNFAYFTNYVKGIGDNITLTAGGRLDKHDKFGTQGTYRTSLAFNIPQSHTKIHTSYGTGFKAPSLYQLYDGFVGNPQLKPEKSKGFDIGIAQEYPRNYVTTDVTFFKNNIENLINGYAPSYVYFNTNRVETYGIESEINIKAMDNLGFFGNHTYTIAEDVSVNRQLARRPKHLFNLGADFTVDKFSGILMGRYVSHQFDNDTSNQKNDAFMTADARATYAINKKVSIYGRIDNIFDADYQEVLSYNTPGLSAYGGLRFNF